VRVRLRTVVLVAALVLAVAVPACSGGEGREDERAAGTGPPPVYVAVGASDSVGVGAEDPATQAWPVLFLREALPPGTRFTNVAIAGATVERALAEEVPKALAVEPDIVTVWLNVNDLRALVPVETYEKRLGDLVRQLRRGGRTTVLVADTPDIDQLPAVTRLGALAPPSVLESAVDRYNAAIARVVRREGAVRVDLNGPSEQAERDGTLAALVSSDGFHPNAAGYERVADAFVAAYRRTLDRDGD
jgi:acyl-CoA thioesterase-1